MALWASESSVAHRLLVLCQRHLRQIDEMCAVGRSNQAAVASIDMAYNVGNLSSQLIVDLLHNICSLTRNCQENSL